MGFIFLIIVLGIVGWAVGKAASNSGQHQEWRCPHGYDSFGCQPHCPLYEHCWGKRED
ncbi:MAG: hypothetical protein IKB90_07475 [Alistipes sp.]|nr:hypothetical protein [Alistipes sp.]